MTMKLAIYLWFAAIMQPSVGKHVGRDYAIGLKAIDWNDLTEEQRIALTILDYDQEKWDDECKNFWCLTVSFEI